jgi:hypothetical protein
MIAAKQVKRKRGQRSMGAPSLHLLDSRGGILDAG